MFNGIVLDIYINLKVVKKIILNYIHVRCVY